MIFADAKLQQHVERAVTIMTSLPDEQRPVCGLLDAFQFFSLTEGEDSPRAAEAMKHLLSAELRPALRSWYRRCGDDMNPAAMEFREHMSELAGERFG
ncbi:MAG: hypothetical protein ACO34E_10125 [Limisphaerales bacterium]